MKADIVCVYTRNSQRKSRREQLNFYRCISTAAITNTTKQNAKGKGGAAIMIKNEWIDNIEQINRYPHRIMEVIIQTGVATKKLHILNTYAPHMCYAQEREKYWKEVKSILNKIPKTNCLYGQRITMGK